MEFDHPPVPSALPTYGPAPCVTQDEVAAAISKMKDYNVVGADDIPSEFWKICGPAGTIWLTGLINQIETASIATSLVNKYHSSHMERKGRYSWLLNI